MDIRKSERLAICAILVGYVILTVAMVKVRPPNADEGEHGSVAAIFERGHYLAMPMLNNIWLPGLDKHLYAVMPLYFVLLSGWFKAFGVDLITMRLFSILWGGIGLLSWYVIVRVSSGDRLIPLLSLVLIGINYDYVDLSSGRYDVMCAALNAAGLAVYLTLRERRLGLALLLSNLLVAAAFMTHPYGVFGLVALILFVTFLDRDRLRLKLLAVSAVPYVVALGAWGLYVIRDVAVFRAQFFTNAGSRLPQGNPMAIFLEEVSGRYLGQMGGWRPHVPVYMKVKILLLAAILVAFIGCCWLREIRQNRNYKLLLILAGAWFLMLTYLEPLKAYGYLIHILPLCFVLIAIWLGTLMKRPGWLHYIATTCVALLALFAVMSVGYRVRLDSYRRVYLPAVAFLQRHVGENAVVIAPGEFGFQLGFDHVLDDELLRSAIIRRPEYIVVSKQTEDDGLQKLKAMDPALYANVANLLAEQYRIAFESRAGYDFYRIYARVSPPPP